MTKALHILYDSFKNIPQSIIIINKDLQLTYCNDFSKSHSIFSDRSLGFHINTFFNNIHELNFSEIGNTNSIETKLGIIAEKGQSLNIEAHITEQKDEQNNSFYIICLNEQERTSELLNELANALEINEALSEATNEALFFSIKGTCIECNKKASDMFGYAYDELIGMFGTDVIAEESKVIVQNNMISGYEKPYEAVALKKDGSKFWAEFQGKMFEYKGKETRVTAVRDISYRKELETKHRFSHNNYKLLFDNMNEAFALHKIILDGNGTPIDYEYVDVNPVFEKLTGLKKENVVGKKLTDILPNIEKYWVEVFGKVSLTGEPIEYTNYAKELGRYFDTRAYSPKQGFFAVAFTDATERIKIESEINFHNESLRSLVKLSQLKVENYIELIRRVLQEGIGMVKGACGAFYFYNAELGIYVLESFYDDEYLEIKESDFAAFFKEVLQKKETIIIDREQIKKHIKNKQNAINSMICIPLKEKGAVPIVFAVGDVDRQLTELEQKHLALFFESAMHVIERQKFQDQILSDKLKAEVYENRFAEIQKAGKIGWYEAILDKGLFHGSSETYMIFFDEHYDFPVGQEHLINAIHPDDREHFFFKVQQGVEKQLSEIEWEYRVVTPKSGVKHVYSKAFLNFNTKGDLVRRYGIVQDITDKKLIEIELKKNNERLESLFKMSQLTSLTIKELFDFVLEEVLALTRSFVGFVFRSNNKTYNFELESYSRGIVTKEDLNKLKDIASQGHFNRISKLIADGKAIINNNALNKSGAIQEVLGNRLVISKTMLVPVKISSEEILWIFVGNETYDYLDSDVRQITLLMDSVWKIIERQNYQNELIEAKNKAQESDNLKSAFLANMSHEIRTPMNGILGFSELIAEDEITDNKRKEYANIVMDSGKQLLSIVDDILDISKIEVGQVRITKELISINDVMKSIYHFFDPKAQSKNIQLILEISEEEIKTSTDEQRLKQILTNLLSNAFKFTSKGEVRLGYNVKNNNIEFFVKDSGIGIPQEMHSIIFERFRQVEQIKSLGYGGTGLGLSISQKLVELLNGNIWVNSSEGKGSSFYFTIPYIS